MAASKFPFAKLAQEPTTPAMVQKPTFPKVAKATPGKFKKTKPAKVSVKDKMDKAPKLTKASAPKNYKSLFPSAGPSTKTKSLGANILGM